MKIVVRVRTTHKAQLQHGSRVLGNSRQEGAAPVTLVKELGFSQEVVLYEGDVAVTCRVEYVLSLCVPFRFCALKARLREAGQQYEPHIYISDNTVTVGEEVGPRA